MRAMSTADGVFFDRSKAQRAMRERNMPSAVLI